MDRPRAWPHFRLRLRRSLAPRHARGSRALWPVSLLPCVACVACVATAEPPPARGVVVSGPPPAPLADDRPPPPAPAAQWIAGYWHWTGVQYTWIPGHWETPPPGARWSAPRYVNADGSYVYEAGRWTQPKAANALR